MAKPRGSRTVSEEPSSSATVEKRTKIGVLCPTCAKNWAWVHWLAAWVASKTLCAVEPRASTTRSGMGSRSKQASFSSRGGSCSRTGPSRVCELRLSAPGRHRRWLGSLVWRWLRSRAPTWRGARDTLSLAVDADLECRPKLVISRPQRWFDGSVAVALKVRVVLGLHSA